MHTTWRKRMLSILFLLVVGGAVWWWLAQPERMRLVRTMPLGSGQVLRNWVYEPAFFGVPGGLCLRLDAAEGRSVPATITLLGWDGLPRWRVSTRVDNVRYIVMSYMRPPYYPEGAYAADLSPDRAQQATLSPDGHVFALARLAGGVWQVESWRDGHPLGRARLDRPAGGYFPMVQATNGGRLWVYQSRGSIDLLAIDGARVSRGRYLSGASPWQLSIAPDGARLLCVVPGAVEYATLLVRGGRVMATRRYTRQKSDQDYAWLDTMHALGLQGQLLGPDGMIHGPQGWQTAAPYTFGQVSFALQQRSARDTVRVRLYRLPPAQPWVVPLNPQRMINGCHTSTDRGAVVFREQGARLPRMLAPLQHLGAISNVLARWPSPRLVLYTAPGTLRAVLPITDRVERFALSPDSHRLAIL
ncbi:MAG TPA: hypothetical protein VGM23_03510, partial [Armatimonadota bacterium]